MHRVWFGVIRVVGFSGLGLASGPGLKVAEANLQKTEMPGLESLVWWFGDLLRKGLFEPFRESLKLSGFKGFDDKLAVWIVWALSLYWVRLGLKRPIRSPMRAKVLKRKASSLDVPENSKD